MADFIDDISINTIIGPGTFVNGGLSVSGFLRIDGDINGDINTPGRVIIAENARVRGNIHAKSITIGGMVQGDVIAPESVVVLSTGLVLGSVLTKTDRALRLLLLYIPDEVKPWETLSIQATTFPLLIRLHLS